MLYIGIDLGTSAVKLVLMEGSGSIRKIVSKEYPLYFPHPGWSEQNPENWWNAVQEGIRELICDQEKDQIAGISFGGRSDHPSGDSLERWPNGAGDRVSQYKDRQGEAVPVYGQYCVCGIYSAEALVDEKTGTGEFWEDL